MLNNSQNLNYYMDILINEAKKETLDIPISALIVKNGEIISIKTNSKEKDNLVTSHAEILALEEANKKLNNWRLSDCDMFVTLEPCPMCAYAIISAKIKNLYFGCFDSLYGAFGGKLNLAQLTNSKINVYGGIKEKECKELLDNYFKALRNN